MQIDDFWALIEESGRQTATRAERTAWLEERLSDRSAGDIADFQWHLDGLRDLVDSFHMWGAASLILDGFCSDDGFWYFQCWLIGLGRETFARVAGDPDELAEVPAVRALAGRRTGEWGDEEWLEWESLDYVADHAHAQVTGVEGKLDEELEARAALTEGTAESRPAVCRSSPQPSDAIWDFGDRAEQERRYPRLASYFRRTGHSESGREAPTGMARTAPDGISAASATPPRGGRTASRPSTRA
ncbi:DUF4240 domain-containing protein [Actinoplanes sp. NPDC049316]|uniref:DUF4240 domain-containing protein n=1 Tax=Actinoplanes sp. NPDC049316 TaxID=3154727 RepID=UPI003423992E